MVFLVDKELGTGEGNPAFEAMNACRLVPGERW